MLFTKRNLFFNDYKWSEYSKVDEKISGKINDTKFNRNEGNEVVYLINKMMMQWNYRFTNTGNKMEKLIREKLPNHLETQLEVQDWVQQHLKF